MQKPRRLRTQKRVPCRYDHDPPAIRILQQKLCKRRQSEPGKLHGDPDLRELQKKPLPGRRILKLPDQIHVCNALFHDDAAMIQPDGAAGAEELPNRYARRSVVKKTVQQKGGYLFIAHFTSFSHAMISLAGVPAVTRFRYADEKCTPSVPATWVS